MTYHNTLNDEGRNCMVGIQLTITWQCDLTETPDETAARLSAQRDRDDYFEVALTAIDSAS